MPRCLHRLPGKAFIFIGFVLLSISYRLGFTMFPERMRRRDDLRPGLRIIGALDGG